MFLSLLHHVIFLGRPPPGVSAPLPRGWTFLRPVRPDALLLAAIVLSFTVPGRAFEIVEREDIFRAVPCPAFLLFVNTAFLSEMTFELPCHCKPEHVNSVVWYYQKSLGSKFTRVLTDFNGTTVVDSGNVRSGADILTRFSIRLFSLIVFQAVLGDSGHYICGTREGKYFYGYDVDIQSSATARVAFEDRNHHPQKDQVEKNFVAFTAFWEWTKCDRCKVRGEQRRIGLCYVKSPYLYPRYRAAQSDAASCGSAAVPSTFKKLIANRKAEIVIRSCTVPCKIRKKGIRRVFQGIQEVFSKLKRVIWKPKVPTQRHTHALGETLALSCPGAKPQHAVAWDRGKEMLYRTEYLVNVNKSMRFYIDQGDHLNFRFVQRNDKGVYNCWLEGKQKAGFRLAIGSDPTKRRKFTDPESIFAMKVIGISFLCFTIIFVGVHCVKCFNHNFRCVPFI